VFAEQAGREAQSRSAAVERLTGILYPETLPPVEFLEYGLVAAKDE
jgi:hypothetical protein